MLTTSWAALTQQAASERYTGTGAGCAGQALTPAGSRSVLQAPRLSPLWAPRLSLLRALHMHWRWAPTTAPAVCCEHSSHHRNQNTEHSAESRLVRARAMLQMPSRTDAGHTLNGETAERLANTKPQLTPDTEGAANIISSGVHTLSTLWCMLRAADTECKGCVNNNDATGIKC